MVEEQAFAARRILVGVDASAASLDALLAAASLASRLGAELTGLYVEDEDLLRLAGLPFADVLHTPGGGRERLDRTSAEVVLRAFGSRARGAFERVASSHGVACSFRMERGRAVSEVLAAADDADIVVLGAAGHGRDARGAVGDTARAAASRARASVLLLARGARLDGVIVAVDDGTPAGARALAAARQLAPSERPTAIVSTRGGAAAIIDRFALRGTTFLILPAPASAALGGVVEGVLPTGAAVLLVR